MPTFGLLECSSGILKVFLNLLPSWRYWSLNEATLGDLGESKNFSQPKSRSQNFFGGRGRNRCQTPMFFDGVNVPLSLSLASKILTPFVVLPSRGPAGPSIMMSS